MVLDNLLVVHTVHFPSPAAIFALPFIQVPVWKHFYRKHPKRKKYRKTPKTKNTLKNTENSQKHRKTSGHIENKLNTTKLTTQKTPKNYKNAEKLRKTLKNSRKHC